MNCTGTLALHDQSKVVLFCSLPADHEWDHYDGTFSYRWPKNAVVGTCHLPPKGGTEVMQ